MRFVLLLAVLPLWAADDADAILKRFIETQVRNDLRAAQYSYFEDAERFTFEKNRHLRKDRTDTFEVILIEGLPYQKLVARNGQPLPPREREQVETEMRRSPASAASTPAHWKPAGGSGSAATAPTWARSPSFSPCSTTS